MLTFLEFYQALMRFINYKLFTDLGLAYPIKTDQYYQGTYLNALTVKEQ